MKTNFTSLRFAAIAMLLSVCSMAASAAAVVKTVGGAGADYATLGLAIADVNTGANGMTGEIVLQLTGNSSETSSENSAFSLNASGSGSASYTSILIYPTADNVVVEGNTNATLAITLDGADNVTIDGRKRDANGSILSQDINLTFNGNGNLFQFSNAATYNTIKFCNLTGKAATNQAILFNADTAGGSDNNTIDNNKISGTLTSIRSGVVVSDATTGNETDYLTIKNNEFFDCVRTNSGTLNFIQIGSYARNFTISGNSFYFTVPFVNSSTNAANHYFLKLDGTNNSEHLVENNYFGGSGPQCSGTMQIDKTSDNTNKVYNFYGISVNKSVAGESKIIVRNNTIKNIEMGVNCTSGTFRGILLAGATTADTEVGLINANFISGINALGTTTPNITGIEISSGSYSLTNNIVSIITNAAGVIYGLQQTTASNDCVQNIHNNTVYLGGSNSSANISASLFYNGTTNTNKKIVNNIFVNARSNTNTNKNFTLVTSSSSSAIPAQLDYNNYYVSGTNGVLARLGSSTTKTALPFISGKDANSITVNPEFTISSPTVALDYKSTVTDLKAGGPTDLSVPTDFEGTTRTSNQMGAFFIGVSTSVNEVKSSVRVYQQSAGSLSIVADLSSVNEVANVVVTDVRGCLVFSKTVKSNRLVIPLTAKGLYFVRVQYNKESSTNKVLVL